MQSAGLLALYKRVTTDQLTIARERESAEQRVIEAVEVGRKRASEELTATRYYDAAKSAVNALEALQSATKVGVTFKDYGQRLQDCQISVDRFLTDHPDERFAGLHGRLMSALNAFRAAHDWWGIKFKGDKTESFVEEMSPSARLIFLQFPALKRDLDKQAMRFRYGYFIDAGIPLLWGYASDAINEARKALMAAPPDLGVEAGPR